MPAVRAAVQWFPLTTICIRGLAGAAVLAVDVAAPLAADVALVVVAADVAVLLGA